MSPTTRELLDAQAALEQAHGQGPLPVREAASPEITAAVERMSSALVGWLLAGGPDRDDPRYGPALAGAWGLRHKREVRRAVALASARGGPALSRMVERARAGAPAYVHAVLDELPASVQAAIGATEARIAASGAVKALRRIAGAVRVGDLDPLALAVAGFAADRAPGWERHLLNLVQATAGQPESVTVKMWAWLGTILRSLLDEPGPLRSLVEPKETGSASLGLVAASGEVAMLNVFFPSLVPGLGPEIAEALCRLLAVALDAPPLEEA